MADAPSEPIPPTADPMLAALAAESNTSTTPGTSTPEPHQNGHHAAAAATTVRHEEHQYLDLIRAVLATGAHRPDRTGTGTLSIFAPPSLRFSLADGTLPLLTTKRTFLRGILEELLWFIHGKTDSQLLAARGVRIWDGNGSKEFLEKRGLGHRREGDLGPVYGFQWRHFGAPYADCDADYAGQGVDQLAECVRKIREDPTDRRIILSAWNPAGMHSMLYILIVHLLILFDDARRYPTHGTTSLSSAGPILCTSTTARCTSRHPQRAVLPDVPALG
jgi:hypothetical protein